MKIKKVFISGGAGFIGSNVAKYHLDKGDKVIVYDNLSRKGTELNLKWLRSLARKANGSFVFIRGDVRNFLEVKKAIKHADIIYHMAAQVAVTTSLVDPRTDFDINALGTLNVLDAYRLNTPDATFVYASTNKVYGSLDDVGCVRKDNRYQFGLTKYHRGISENRDLDFHSPYGCSKGAGDQYVRDYGRVYGLKTIVFRQSCIYGPRQFGNEDQGWVMHFVRTAVEGKNLSIYGDGYQVRDLLHVNDLIKAYQVAIKKVRKGQGMIFNVGGGIKNAVSLREVVILLEEKLGEKIRLSFSDWREGDQRIYVSDNSKIKSELGWAPKITVEKGIDDLIRWAKEISPK